MTPHARVLAVIPARGGSRGLSRKPLRLLGGLPLIAHTIRAGRDARRIDHVMVTTDDPAIRSVAVAHGADAPFLRPTALATNTAPTAPAVLHAVAWHERTTGPVATVVVLQPTSPLRSASEIDAAVDLLDDRSIDSAVSVTSTGFPTSILGSRVGGRWIPLAGVADVRRQSSPEAYRLTGGIYVTRRAALSEAGILGERVAALVVDAESGIDIDTAEDLRLARAAWRRRSR